MVEEKKENLDDVQLSKLFTGHMVNNMSISGAAATKTLINLT